MNHRRGHGSAGRFSKGKPIRHWHDISLVAPERPLSGKERLAALAIY
jgi:hypothetical protein